ncbi:hypothetical protein E2C01_070522 [Portunus trituberculatus]|uniref:Uncharacterized protein n=1 Tax=Portunus trituberculatus TaxID=210409 RepID=A0A5B7I3P6_PORTR|nr:hypothetical protein [Portunus trituberculatus]
MRPGTEGVKMDVYSAVLMVWSGVRGQEGASLDATEGRGWGQGVSGRVSHGPSLHRSELSHSSRAIRHGGGMVVADKTESRVGATQNPPIPDPPGTKREQRVDL